MDLTLKHTFLELFSWFVSTHSPSSFPTSDYSFSVSLAFSSSCSIMLVIALSMSSPIWNEHSLPTISSSLAVLWRCTYFQSVPAASTKSRPSPCKPGQELPNTLAPRKHSMLNTIAILISLKYHFGTWYSTD